MKAKLEHVNVTVSDPDATAALMCAVFGWRVRWKGPSKMGGRTVHVGEEETYLAVYALRDDPADATRTSGEARGGLNHIGVVVDDLAAAEQRVIAAGHEPFNHMDYEPGRRFYFRDGDNIEFEVVSYAKA
jgi:catechol 2,3-dioxygenase-like lactoylglutathione lyase family enzyme